MPAPFQEVLNSRIFKFTVGESVDGKACDFPVHEDAIAQLSKPLYGLTKGDSEEAREGRATWPDVSKDTFGRFAQFAYTGDYSIPPTQDWNAASERQKIEASVPTPPTSPKPPNGLRSGFLSSVSTVQHHDRSATTADGDEPTAEKLLDEDGAILNYPINKKNRKKKRSKSEAKQSIPEPGPEPELEAVKEAEPEPEHSEFDSVDREQDGISVATKEDTEEELTLALTAEFPTLSYPLLAPRDHYAGTCEPDTSFEKSRSYSHIFLSHATLYVLGGAQLVDSLKALALFKLHKTLSAFELNEENTGDFTVLARYAYSEEGKKVEDGYGGLRGLVCHFMARHAMELSQEEKFMNFLAEGGQVVKDFFKFGMQRKN